DVQNNMITFREIADAECFNYAYDFVCNLLQPSCIKGVKEDVMVLPCKSFCREFMQGCGSRLQPKIKSIIDCNRFPEFKGVGSCIHRPNFVPSNLTSELSAIAPNGVNGVANKTSMAQIGVLPTTQDFNNSYISTTISSVSISSISTNLTSVTSPASTTTAQAQNNNSSENS
ncbi:hypothetical protein AMK59_3852, partial [Oryctes borbonicus]